MEIIPLCFSTYYYIAVKGNTRILQTDAVSILLHGKERSNEFGGINDAMAVRYITGKNNVPRYLSSEIASYSVDEIANRIKKLQIQNITTIVMRMSKFVAVATNLRQDEKKLLQQTARSDKEGGYDYLATVFQKAVLCPPNLSCVLDTNLIISLNAIILDSTYDACQLPLESRFHDYEPFTGDSNQHCPRRERMDFSDARIGIITALPKEYAAMKKILGDSNENEIFNNTRGNAERYLPCRLKSADGKIHNVVLMMCGEENNSAAISCTQLLSAFPGIKSIVMCGIAGGFPNPDNPKEHIRLGDIVVADSVFQYDYGKKKGDSWETKAVPTKVSSAFRRAINVFRADEYANIFRWRHYVTENAKGLFARPDESTDVLYDRSRSIIPHPEDTSRQGFPIVHYGCIASANIVLKDPNIRDTLRMQHKAIAAEMEGSGIADAATDDNVNFVIIRGICDYCDTHKNDIWQEYAALVAAAYTRSLIEALPSFDDLAATQPSSSEIDIAKIGAKKKEINGPAGIETMPSVIPKVFISYSWDDDAHKEWVKHLADDLIASGRIQIIFDQKDLKLGDPLPQFMEQSIENCDYVLFICTPKYKNRADQRTGGVGYEDTIITGDIFSRSNHRKYIPVLARGSWADSTPVWARGKLGVDMSTPPKYALELSTLVSNLSKTSL